MLASYTTRSVQAWSEATPLFCAVTRPRVQSFKRMLTCLVRDRLMHARTWQA